MSVDGNIHAALMARAETISDYPILWPQKGGEQPAEEHVRVSHLPNDNEPADLNSQVQFRQGFLVLTLVSPLNEHEASTRRKAGEIAGVFPRGMRLTDNGVTVTITGYTIRPGREENARWETPIRISYRSTA